MMMIRLIGVLLIAMTGFVSCQKTTDTLPIETPTEDSTCRIVKLHLGALDANDTVFTYLYDDQNRLVTIVDKGSDGVEFKYVFEYDGVGKVKQVQFLSDNVGPDPNKFELITKADYIYNGSLLVKIEIQNDFYPMVLDVTFEYDGDGKQVKRSTEGIFMSTPIKDYITYEYDPKGNISRKRWYENDTLAGISEFTYNNEENIIKAFGLGMESIVSYSLGIDHDAYLNTNNLTSIVDKESDGSVYSLQEITYIKDSTNRIIKLQSKCVKGYLAPGVFSYHFFYDCK
jgi:hypothetical protein